MVSLTDVHFTVNAWFVTKMRKRKKITKQRWRRSEISQKFFQRVVAERCEISSQFHTFDYEVSRVRALSRAQVIEGHHRSSRGVSQLFEPANQCNYGYIRISAYFFISHRAGHIIWLGLTRKICLSACVKTAFRLNYLIRVKNLDEALLVCKISHGFEDFKKLYKVIRPSAAHRLKFSVRTAILA